MISSYCNLGGCVEVAFVSPSRCHTGECVEVAFKDGEIQVRDTKNRDLPPHRYSVEEWEAFVAGVKDGEFDLSVLQR